MQQAQRLFPAALSSDVEFSSAFSVSKSCMSKTQDPAVMTISVKAHPFWCCQSAGCGMMTVHNQSHTVMDSCFLINDIEAFWKQHCTMTPHLKAQIRWLVTCGSRSQNFMHARASCDQSAWTSAPELEETAINPAQRKGLMETSSYRDYWSRNTVVSKVLPFSKSNITIWNLRLNTCAAYR